MAVVTDAGVGVLCAGEAGGSSAVVEAGG